jgi:predicted enzyme related to lactoylglutathione lyase
VGCVWCWPAPRGPHKNAAIGRQAGGWVWLFLQTRDFVADAARITAAGGRFEQSARHGPYGIVAVWRDPSGNRWA